MSRFILDKTGTQAADWSVRIGKLRIRPFSLAWYGHSLLVLSAGVAFLLVLYAALSLLV